MKRLGLLRASGVVALASLLAFGIQVVFALFMLRLFSPASVGEFSLLSQIGFFWMTLALAQAPLRLLANAHIPPGASLREALRASLLRGLWLLPLVMLALWLSDAAFWPACLWVLLLAMCQLGNMLAQSLSLRTAGHWQQALVRVLPPFVAAGAAGLGAMWQWTGPTLVLSAIGGYAVGAAFLVPLWVVTRQDNTSSSASASIESPTPSQFDPRSTHLRLAHTLTDALLATALVVVWQRWYGAQETGWMSALLRVLGFVPALVHMAWAQVLLAHEGQQTAHSPSASTTTSHRHHLTPLRLGSAAFGAVALLGLACDLALQWGLLDARWHGVTPYLFAMCLWQGCACLSAAFSHRPFQTGHASTYSRACIALTVAQSGGLLLPWVWDTPLSASQHMLAYAVVSAIGLSGLTLWMARLPDRNLTSR